MEQNTTSVVIEQQGENKKRGALAVILAVAFVAMLGIGSTFAYLSWTGNQTPNRFTADLGLKVDLVEPSWTTAVNDAANVQKAVASDGVTKIPEKANNFTKAKDSLAKDPYVVNTSSVGNETDPATTPGWVGIRLTFQKWIAETINDQTGTDHRENGYYKTMEDDEAKALLTAYAFTQETTAGTAGTATQNLTSGGITPGTGWTRVSADGTTTGATGLTATQYFVYNEAIIPITVDDFQEDGSYPVAASTAPSTGAGKTTTTLFNTVTVVNTEAIGTFNGLIQKQSSTTDPGWRVLVDTAAVQAPEADKAKSPISNKSRCQDIINNFPTVREDGKSPKGSKYVTKDGAVTGSGVAQGKATNVPESYWGWAGAKNETNWKATGVEVTEDKPATTTD